MPFIGVDLGGTKIQAIRLNQDPSAPAEAPANLSSLSDAGSYIGPVGSGLVVTGSGRVPTPISGPEAVADAIVGAVKSAGADDLYGVGIGFAGPIDSKRGLVLRAPNVQNFGEQVPFAQMVSDRLGGVPVFLENDVNAGTYGEWKLGAGKGVEDLLGIFWGTGVGGGLVLDGKMRRGPHGFAGEVGHIIVKEGGRKPLSGFQGSLEAYAGRASMEASARRKVKAGQKTELLEIAAHKGRDRLTSGVFRRAYKHGDRMAVDLVRKAEYALGIGIASITNVLDLEMVVVGGGVAESFGQPMVDRVIDIAGGYYIAPEAAPQIRLAMLGDLAGGLGAALAARDELGGS